MALDNKTHDFNELEALSHENWEFYERVIVPALKFITLPGTPFQVGYGTLIPPNVKPEFKNKGIVITSAMTTLAMRISVIKASYELGIPVHILQNPGLGESAQRDKNQSITDNTHFYTNENGRYRIVPGDAGLFGLMDKGVEFYLRTIMLPEIETGKKFVFVTESVGGAALWRVLVRCADIRNVLSKKSTIVAVNTTFNLSLFGKYISDPGKAFF